MSSLDRHQEEIQRNQRSWESKPLLQRIYADFYRHILTLIDRGRPGPVVELGSGIGNLKQHLPDAISSDLFPNPWLDLVCDGYDLPFVSGTISHLVLFDVFHHLEAPAAFLHEARRVLAPQGRLILFEPYISLASFGVYGLLHPEPVGWRRPISEEVSLPPPRRYYAAQGNATRLFFHHQQPSLLAGWTLQHAETLSALSYLLSGGYSKPALIREGWLPSLQRMESRLARWPRLFGTRCLVSLSKQTET